MPDNKIIKGAYYFGKALLVLCVVLFIFFTLMFVYWHVNPTAFQHVDIAKTFEPGYGLGGIQLYFNESQIRPGAVLLSDVDQPILYWIYLRGVLFFLITFMMLRYAIRILKSLRNLNTFYAENISSLKSIAYYAFAGAVLACFNAYKSENGWQISLDLPLAPLALALSCLVLAEVFKEGRHLAEEQKLIV